MLANELKLIEGEKEQRDKYIERIDILEKVKEINILAGTNFMTTRQVADFYEVVTRTIQHIWADNRGEIQEDGVQILKGNEIKKLANDITFEATDVEIQAFKGYSLVGGARISNGNNILFPKRAVLRIGMLLRDSPVAKEIRTLLLNVYHIVNKSSINK